MKKKEYFIYFLVGFVFFVATVLGARADEVVQFQQDTDKEIISLNIAKYKPHKVFTVANPDRLVIDVPLVRENYTVSLPDNYKGKLIKSVRFGRFDHQTSRFVFDLNQAIRILSTNGKRKKLIVEIDDKISESLFDAALIDKTTKKDRDLKIYKKHKANAPPVIVIDAGHGGVDPGAIGAAGTKEKNIVLEYAKALRAKLLKTRKYRVFLTRSDDEFIRLHSRVAIARKANASLFISLHADSAEGEGARGLSVYTVSENASDKEAEALAARENKADIIGGMDLSDERADVADILISLAQRETKNNSAIFADFLVVNLNDKVRMLPNSHRFAGFAVLKAADVPSVLIEIGFLSNPQEEKEIKSKTYRNNVVDGIVAGVEAYFRRKASFGMAVL